MSVLRVLTILITAASWPLFAQQVTNAAISPATGPVIVIVNSQHKAPVDVLQDAAREFTRITRLPMRVETAESIASPLAAGAQALAAGTNHVAFAVVIRDMPDEPRLLVAPESRWALVNVAALGDATVPPNVVADRLKKEVWRATCYVLGAANATSGKCVMNPVFDTADLDSIGRASNPEFLAKMMQQAMRRGMQPERTAPQIRLSVEKRKKP